MIKKYCVFFFLYRDPHFTDVKVAQAKYLVSRLSQFQKKLFKKLNYIPAVIVCGDFNSMPENGVGSFFLI